MDLSKLSTADLEALQSGDLSKVSTEGLSALSGEPARPFGSGRSFDVGPGGQVTPTGSYLAHRGFSPVAETDPNAAKPVTNEIGTMLTNALPAAGKFFTDRWLGIKQVLGNATEQDAADKRTLDAPLSQATGGQLGQTIAGGLSAIPLSAIPGANTYMGAAAIGGLYGATQPTVQGESRAANVGTGALLGMGGQFVSNRIGNWLTARDGVIPLTPAQQQIGEAGEQIGLQRTPGQITGNQSLQQAEAAMASNPWSSGPFNELAAANRRATGAAAARAIGEPGDVVDSTVLQNASDRLGQIFDSVRDPSRIVMSAPQATTNALDQIDQNYLGTFNGNTQSIRENPLVTKLENLVGSGSINMEQLGAIRSNLGRAANNQMTSAAGDRQLGQALFDVQGHVDNLIQSNLAPAEQQTYGQALAQYRALRQLTNRVGTLNPSTGDVSPVALGNYLQQTDRPGFLMGGNQSDLYTAARFGQAYKPVVGNSGTATRSWNPLSVATGIPRSIMSSAYMSPVGQALVTGAAGARVATAPPLAVGQALQPYLIGLPGASATLLPYLTE